MRRLARGDRLVLASHNAGKLKEFDALLSPFGITLLSAGALGLPEPEETGTSFAENARLKAEAAATAAGLPALADDSGFCVRALGGAPGIYSARWGGPAKDSLLAMTRVHEEGGAALAADPAAWFVAVLCLAWPGGEDAVFEGRVEGRVAWPPQGAFGHGYDPIFIPEGETRRFAEMPEAEKNQVSHRGRAFGLFREACLPA